jgi:hypothetical protein
MGNIVSYVAISSSRPGHQARQAPTVASVIISSIKPTHQGPGISRLLAVWGFRDSYPKGRASATSNGQLPDCHHTCWPW